MTTSNESEAKQPLKLSRPGKLQLKKTVETGQVRQSFSHGRSKAVTVEVKRSRTFERGSSGRMTEELGSASCRESVCTYVYISVVAGGLKKKRQKRRN